MRVTNDLALRVKLLRGGEVVLLGIDEVTGLEVGDGHGNREWGVRGDGVTVGGDGELGRRHVVR